MSAGSCPSFHYPTHPRKVCLWCIFFSLPVMSGPLPAELKLRENTVSDNYSQMILLFLLGNVVLTDLELRDDALVSCKERDRVLYKLWDR